VRAESAPSLDPGIISLKILASALMNRIESLQEDIGQSRQLDLQNEVHRFEADLIRMALIETGGRQRRAAKLLGLKATTLSTKIKRHGISVNPSHSLNESPADKPPSEPE
jgi:DNA-binding NtrC family response regulator